MNIPISIKDRNGRRSGYAFILIFSLMTIGIALIGYFYYLNYEQNFRAEVEGKLSSIAELKVGELALWRKERLGDGSTLFRNIAFSALVRRFLEEPGDVDAQRQFQDWMGKYLTAYHYTQVYLADIQGRMRMSVPQLPESYVSPVTREVTDILRSGQVGIEDFHRNTPDGPIHLAVVVPVFDDLDDGRPLGVLFLHIDPKTYLYSFISHWPAPSKTGETLLVRRDGDDALFLNELRFREDAPLNFRIPLTRTEVPAVRAALGQTGMFEGVDYRGAPVIAVVRTVPDSPWSMVARMNTSEVYAPARERLWLVVSVTGFLVFGSAAAMGYIWRQRSADYRAREKAMEVVRESEARFRQLAEATFEGVVIMENNRILDANKSFLQMFGYEKLDEIVGRRDVEFTAPEYCGRVFDHIATGCEKPYEIMAIRKDGSRFPIEVHGRTREIAGRQIRITASRDITERREYEEELKRSNADLEQFSYAVSHDMRQPLRMISSYLQLLEMGLADQLDCEKRGYFDIAIAGAKRIDRMLVELLEYSRVGRMGEPPAWIESRAALDEALQFLQPAVAEAQARLTISGDWPRIYANHDEILSLLQNLIGNAVKFRVAGRTPEITVISEVVRNEWILNVADNGVGIIPDQIKRLFKVFQRMQTRAAYEGTGIGLALCRKIAEHHKGRIWAESAGEGQGSRFCVVLPIPLM